MTKRNSTDAIASKQTKKYSTKRLTTEEFKKRARKAHGSTYCYDLVVYKNTKSKVDISCDIHGVFSQYAGDHLAGRGCNDCAIDARAQARAFSNSDFKRIAGDLHDGVYDYKLTEYKNSHSRVKIICPTHGVFEQNARMHLQGQGCNRCGREEMAASRSTSFNDFVRKANKTHSGRYTYNKKSYIRMSAKTEITCHEHGAFLQIAGNHASGQGCPDCALLSSGFGFSSFKRSCDRNDNGNGKLYVIEFIDKGTLVYKIGITSRTVKARFTATHFLPYDYKKIYLVNGCAEFIFNLERRLHNLLKEYKYNPSKWFAGETECFATIKPIEKLLKELSSTEQLQLLA